MLGNPNKIRTEPMTIRFTQRERAMIDWMAEQAGVSPAYLVYEWFTDAARFRVLEASQSKGAEGSRA